MHVEYERDLYQEGLDSTGSRLDAIRETLGARPLEVFVAGEIVHEQHDGEGPQRVDILVAPTAPAFEPGELNTFMKGLFPEKLGAQRTLATHAQEGGLRLGHLQVDEQDQSTRIHVRVYPDPISALTLWQYERGRQTGVIVYSEKNHEKAKTVLKREPIAALKAYYRGSPPGTAALS